MRKLPLFAATVVFFFLLIRGDRGVAAYLLRAPDALDARSIRIMLAGILAPLAGTAFIFMLSWGCGRRLLRLFAGPEEGFLRGPLAHCFSTGLGLGAIACGVFFLGLAGLLNRWGCGLLMLLPAALALPERLARPRWVGPAFLSIPESVLAGLLAYAAWHASATALAPPTEWDVLAYHLALPKLYAGAGRIMELPWLLHSHWPHLMEAFYALPLAAGADTVPALLHAAVCGLWIFAVFQAAHEFLDLSAAWIGSALLAVSPLLQRFAGAAHSDGAWAFFQFLGFLAVWNWSRSGRTRWLMLAGVMGGLAAASKLFGVIPFAIMGLWIFSARSERRGGALAAYLACGLVVAAPWYLKAYRGSGDPVWPFLSSWFGGRWGGPEIEAAYIRSNYWTWPPDAGLLLRYGPLWLLVPAAIVAAQAAVQRLPWPPFLKFLWFPVPFYLLFIFRHQEAWRFFLPFLPALALTVGWWASRLKPAGLLAVGLGLAPVFFSSENNQLFPVLGLRSSLEPEKEPREVYLERSLDHYRFFQDVDRLLLGKPAKVLLFREIRGFYLDAPYQWGDPLNQGLILYDSLRDEKELGDRLKALGITHVLVNAGVAMYSASPGYYSRRTISLMDGLLGRRAKLALREGPLALYEL